ncbi:hypothetical protein [Micromonospora sp. KC207]|uniref:CdiA C-terminal domain-containing protein n=1 Tax=Micromonospora sp. KC207 TaxID=2530377 RepID=UPI00352D82D6
MPVASRSNRRVWWLVGGAAFLTLALCAGLAVSAVWVISRWSDGEPGRADRQAATLLYEAARTLYDSEAQRYRGTLTTDLGTPVRIESQVTSDGTILSRVELDGTRGELLDMGYNGMYARGGTAFWAALDAPLAEATLYGDAWVRVDPDTLGFDQGELVPATLAETLVPGVGDGDGPAPELEATLGELRTIDGVEVRQVRTRDALASITTGQPRRMVRLESTRDRVPTTTRTSRYGGGSPAGGGYQLVGMTDDDELELDLSALSPAELDEFFAAVKQRVQQLADAFDSQVSFNLDGNGRIGPCLQTSCLATYTIRNQVDLQSEYLRSSGPVSAEVTITMTLDGRPVRTCAQSVTMPPNGSATVQCLATYTLPRTRTPKTYKVRAEIRARAKAVVKADIDRMIKDVARLEAARRARQNPAAATPPPPAAAPAAGTSPTGPAGGRPTGPPARIEPGMTAENKRSLQRENEAANILADKGYRVQQNPNQVEAAAARAKTGDVGKPTSKPDMLVEGKVFDVYSPSVVKKVRGIWTEASKKVDGGQTQRVLINLKDWPGELADLRKQFTDWPIPGLKEVKVITSAGEIFPLL